MDGCPTQKELRLWEMYKKRQTQNTKENNTHQKLKQLNVDWN